MSSTDIREGLRQYDDIDQQHAHEQLGRVLLATTPCLPALDACSTVHLYFVMKGASFAALNEIFSSRDNAAVAVRATAYSGGRRQGKSQLRITGVILAKLNWPGLAIYLRLRCG